MKNKRTFIFGVLCTLKTNEQLDELVRNERYKILMVEIVKKLYRQQYFIVSHFAVLCRQRKKLNILSGNIIIIY